MPAGELGSWTVGMVENGYQKWVVTCTSTPFRRFLGVLQAQELGEESIQSIRGLHTAWIIENAGLLKLFKKHAETDLGLVFIEIWFVLPTPIKTSKPLGHSLWSSLWSRTAKLQEMSLFCARATRATTLFMSSTFLFYKRQTTSTCHKAGQVKNSESIPRLLLQKSREQPCRGTIHVNALMLSALNNVIFDAIFHPSSIHTFDPHDLSICVHVLSPIERASGVQVQERESTKLRS